MSDNQDKLKKLCVVMNTIMTLNKDKEDQYINFLNKHKLRNSGPTPELLSSLNKEQREELSTIFK